MRGSAITATAPSGWGGRIRTFEYGIQSPAPYRLATPHSRAVAARPLDAHSLVARTGVASLELEKRLRRGRHHVAANGKSIRWAYCRQVADARFSVGQVRGNRQPSRRAGDRAPERTRAAAAAARRRREESEHRRPAARHRRLHRPGPFERTDQAPRSGWRGHNGACEIVRRTPPDGPDSRPGCARLVEPTRNASAVLTPNAAATRTTHAGPGRPAETGDRRVQAERRSALEEKTAHRRRARRPDARALRRADPPEAAERTDASRPHRCCRHQVQPASGSAWR